jgi:hypothetical protein
VIDKRADSLLTEKVTRFKKNPAPGEGEEVAERGGLVIEVTQS